MELPAVFTVSNYIDFQNPDFMASKTPFLSMIHILMAWKNKTAKAKFTGMQWELLVRLRSRREVKKRLCVWTFVVLEGLCFQSWHTQSLPSLWMEQQTEQLLDFPLKLFHLLIMQLFEGFLCGTVEENCVGGRVKEFVFMGSVSVTVLCWTAV